MKPTLEGLCDVPAQVLCLSATPPLIQTGRVVSCRAEDLELDLEDPHAGFREGLHVVLAGDEETPFRIMGTVAWVKGSRLGVKAERVVDIDKRDFPRLQAGISVRYRRIGETEAGDAVRAWVAGEAVPAEGEWQVPDPFMDFSGSGLRFEDRLCCSEGDLLLLEMQIPPSGSLWRATARVVRLTPIQREYEEGSQRDVGSEAPTHHVAVAFEQVPPDAVAALAAYALRIQDALLKI